MLEKIVTEEDYQAALVEIERLMDIDPEVGSAEGEELDKLANLLEAYEAKKGWGFDDAPF